MREPCTGPVGAVLCADDPLARRDHLMLADLADCRWFQFPAGTDPNWRAYWNGGVPREGSVVRVVQECLQAVLWDDIVGIASFGRDLPGDLVVVAVIDMAPSHVVARNGATPTR